nr:MULTISPECIES: coenzyme F430 synthase [Methanothermococcus]
MLVIDVNHGALDLAKELLNLGYDVDVWDIYGKLEKDVLKGYLDVVKKINLIKSKEKPVFENYDKIIAPIHCPIDFPFVPFHDAVSEIIKEKYGKIHKKFIEVTGVKGKTTTTEMINFILKDDYNVFLHNSNKGSITPVILLNILEENENNIDNIDYFIFEVSLGLTSCGYGAITNIAENYPIAGGRRNALVKMDFLKNADKKYVNKFIIDDFNIPIDLKDLNDINLINSEDVEILSKYPLKYKYNNLLVQFNKNIFGKHLVEDSMFAIEISKNFLDYETILERIKRFNLKNRMNIEKKGSNYIIKNINPGLDLKAIDYAINDFIGSFNSGYIVVGGDFGCTCEEINIERLSNVIKKWKNKNKNIRFLFAGDVGKRLKDYVKPTFLENSKVLSNVDDIFNLELGDNVLIIYRTSII